MNINQLIYMNTDSQQTPASKMDTGRDSLFSLGAKMGDLRTEYIEDQALSYLICD